MTAKDLFQEEELILSQAADILGREEFADNPLIDKFSNLLAAYSKLFKQHKRIIRLSDKQHARLSVLNSSMKNVLDNIPVGIAVLDKDGRVHPMYSKYMHTLFGKDTAITGADIVELLYWEEGREKERDTFRNWLPLVFDASYDWDLIGGLGPDMIQHVNEAGDLYFRNSFHRIVHENGDLSLMVYILDVSERIRQRIALQEQEAAHTFELEVLSCFVNTENTSELIDFMNDSERMVREGTRLFEEIPQAEDQMPLFHHMFRLMHSLKGLARTYGLNEFGHLAHAAEDVLEKYRSREMSFESGMIEGSLGSEKLASILEKMKHMLGNCERIINKIVNQGRENAASIRGRRRGLKIDEDVMDDLIREVGAMRQAAGTSDTLVGQVDGVMNRLFQLTLQPLDVVYNRFHNIVKDVSETLGKQAELIVEGDRVFLGPEAHHLIITSLIHILRNALDHGIEAPDYRKQQGKDPMGRIRLTTRQDEERVVVETHDDGGGISPEGVVKQALSKGLLTEEDALGLTDQQKIELIFLPGFSARESVTEFSGRGVGMDVVAEAMKSLNGDLSISSVTGQGVTIRMSFPTTKNLSLFEN